MKKKLLMTLLAAVALITLAACSSNANSGSGSKTRSYTIGVASDQEKTEWEQAAKTLKKENIKISIKEFSDYTEENPALEDGSLDLNAFQSKEYLDNWNKENKGNLVNIGWTYISPFGLYSEKIKSPSELKDGDTIAIPNDPTNEGRALNLLQDIGVIKLKADAGVDPSTKDIETYIKKITIKTLDASQIAASLPDVTAACINTNYVQDQLHETPKDAIYRDTDNASKANSVYKNLVAVTKKNENKADFKKIVKAYETEAVEKIIEKGGDKAAWK